MRSATDEIESVCSGPDYYVQPTRRYSLIAWPVLPNSTATQLFLTPSAQVKLLTQGLVKREEALERIGEDSREAAEDAERSAVAFSALAAREAVTSPVRRAAAEAAVAEQRARETALQERYKALSEQLADLHRRGAAGPPAQSAGADLHVPQPIAA